MSAVLLAACCLLFAGCRMDMQDQPRYEAYEPGDKKFFRDGAASRPLVESTVPRGFLREDALLYTGRADGQPGAGPMSGGSTGGVGTAVPNTASMTAGTTTQVSGDPNVRGNVAGGIPGAAGTGGPDIFPASVPIDEATLERGRDRFNAYCAICHGAAGDSDGMIVRRGFQKPPSFHEDRLQEPTASAAHFFDVITNGWGAMPSYAEMIPPRDRWAIIAYVRALQLSRRMSASELSAEERGRVETDAQRLAAPPQSGTQTQGEPQKGGVRH